MTQYRDILRLHKQGISGRGIAASLSCSRNTVSEVLQAAKALGIEWPLPDAVSDQPKFRMKNVFLVILES